MKRGEGMRRAPVRPARGSLAAKMSRLLLLAAVTCHLSSGFILHAVARSAKLPVAGRQTVTMGGATNAGDGHSNRSRRSRCMEKNRQSRVGKDGPRKTPKRTGRQKTVQESAVQFVVEDCKNDYELVIRISKAIESVLERDYGANATSVAKAGLGAKIKVARTANGDSLPPKLVKNVELLADMRNLIAHDVSVDAIDRQKFQHISCEVMAELNMTLPTVKGRAPLQSLQTGDIVFGEVVGYAKKNSTARVHLLGVEEHAELPYNEISQLDDFTGGGGAKPITERIEIGHTDYFEVLNTSQRRVVVSMKSYISDYYMRLLKNWAEIEDYEYACIREQIPADTKPAEAFAEAERLAREHFMFSQMGEPDFSYCCNNDDY